MTEKKKKKKPLPKKPASKKKRGRPAKVKLSTSKELIKAPKKKTKARAKTNTKANTNKPQTSKPASKAKAKAKPKAKPKSTSTRTKAPKKPLSKDKLNKDAKGGRNRAEEKAERIKEQTRIACQYEKLAIYTDGSIGCDDIFDDQYHCQKVLELFQTGVLEAELPIEMGINPATLYYWAGKFPQFATVLKMGRLFSRSWWISQGRRNIGNPFFNVKLYQFMMVNNFKWATKIDPDELFAKFADFNLSGEKTEDGPDYENMDKKLLELLDEHVCTINGDSDGNPEAEESNTA